MRCRLLQSVFVAAVVAAAGIASPYAAPLTAAELSTLRETQLINGKPSTSPTEAAMALARRIGSEGNLDGLKAIIEARRGSLLSTAIQSMDPQMRVLPEPLEALIVESFGDRDAFRGLLAIVGRAGGGAGESYPRYRSHALFDLIYREMTTKRSDAFGLTYKIVATDLQGIEPEIVAALPLVDVAAAEMLASFLGRRRYAPAVPALRKLQADVPFARDSNGMLGRVNGVMLQIGTAEAVEAVLDRLRWLGGQTDSRAANEMAGVLATLQRMPPETKPDFPSLRKALPDTLPPAVQQALVALIVARKDKRGMADLVIGTGQGSEQALVALLDWGAPADWRAGKASLDATLAGGAVEPKRAAYLRDMQKRLDVALADPARQVAAAGDKERKQEFAAARNAIDVRRMNAANLRDSDPARYMSEVDAALRSAEKLVADNAGREEATWYRRDLASEATRAAAYARFTLGDPRRAVGLYERAIALADGLPASESGGLLQRAGLADTLRFDLKDDRRSLRVYEELLQRSAVRTLSNSDSDAVSRRLMSEWIRAEIAFVREGKRYAGTPDRQMLLPIAMAVMGGSSMFIEDDRRLSAMAKILHSRAPSADERREFALALEALSPSQARLLNAIDFLPLLGSPQRVAAYLRKHDPAGYLTASVFAAWHYFEAQAAGRATPGGAMPGMSMIAWSEAERALMRNAEVAALGRKVPVDTAIDSRLASPESTWKTFLAALRRADLDAAWKCTTPGIRNKFEDTFTTMSPSDLMAMADSIVGFQRSVEMGEYVEAIVVRKGGHAGAVTFFLQGKEWLISEM